MELTNFRHVIEQIVRWGDMDAMGHVNNVQYLRYLESGRIAYLERVLESRRLADENFILADIQCSFRQQLRYPATVQVATRANGLGNSSLRLTCAIFVSGSPQPVATGNAVMVWFDFGAQRTKPVPEAVREAIRAFEAVPD